MKKVHQKKGFTIIETLVAVSILVIGITAPVTVIYSSIQASRVAADKVFAYYLAQESVEYVRYARDTNIINGDNWLRFIANRPDTNTNCDNGSPCDVTNSTALANNNNDFRNCGNGDGLGCFVRWSNGQDMFLSNQAGPYGFRRGIVVTENIDEMEATIVVTVTWDTNNNTYNYVLRERIFNWSDS